MYASSFMALWEDKMADTAIRNVTSPDVPRVARTLARAFQDDPAFAWAAPDTTRRQRHASDYFRLLVERVYLPKGEVYMTTDGACAALWAPPDNWQTSSTASLPMLPTMLKACGRKLPRTLRMLSLMETKHKAHAEPHYYLAFIGTDPDARGQGRGTALLHGMLQRCDSEGVPAYLEATSVQNQALYHRHGFTVIEELHWPGGGPPFWPMWRTPT